LRDELGLAYTVHASISSSAGVSPGTFTAYIGTSPENVGTALEGFLEEMRRIQEEPVTASELELVKSYLVGSFPMGYERAARRASYLISSRIHRFPDDYLETLPRAFEAVTPEDIQRAAKKHLHPGACCLSASGAVSKRELKSARRRVLS
jgi:zinc protease